MDTSPAKPCDTEHVWSWAQEAIQYGVGPLIAAGAVIWTQRRADRRAALERDERSAEREQAKAAAESQERAALRERWRDDRRQAHATLVLALLDVYVWLNDQHHRLVEDAPRWLDDHDHRIGRVAELADSAWTAFAQVRLIGSASSRDAGARAMEQLERARSLFVEWFTHCDEEWFIADEKVLDAVKAFLKGMGDYELSARADLEVD